MQILVMSDLHGKEETVDFIQERVKRYDPDIVVICGDITHFGKPHGFARKIAESLKVKLLAVPGNCDPAAEVIADIEVGGGASIHGKTVMMQGIRFTGLGGGPVSPHLLPFELGEEEMRTILEPTIKEGAVLVTHAPGKGHLDMVPGGGSLGSEAIAAIVKRYRPILHLSGHVHEARGIENDGTTVYVNPGPAKSGFSAIVKIGEDEKIEARLL